MLVNVHGDLDVFMPQAVLHILGGGTQLRKHGGVGVPQRMVVEFLNPQFLCCNSADMLHSSAVDVGTIRANHDKMNFFPHSIRIQTARFIPELADVKVAIEGAGFFLTGFLAFQHSYHIRRKFNRSDAVILGEGEVPICRSTRLLILFLPKDLLTDGQLFALKVNAGPVQSEGFSNPQATLVLDARGTRKVSPII